MEPSQLTVGNRTHELAAIVALIRASHRPVPVDQLATLIDHAGSAVELVQLKLEDVLFSSPEANLGVAGTVSAEELDAAVSDVQEWLARHLDMRTVLDAHYPQSCSSSTVAGVSATTDVPSRSWARGMQVTRGSPGHGAWQPSLCRASSRSSRALPLESTRQRTPLLWTRGDGRWP